MWQATMLLLQNRTWRPYRVVGGQVVQGLRKCSDIEGQVKVFGGAAQPHKHACKAQATRPALLSQHWVRWRHLHFRGLSKYNSMKTSGSDPMQLSIMLGPALMTTDRSRPGTAECSHAPSPTVYIRWVPPYLRCEVFQNKPIRYSPWAALTPAGA